MRDDEKIAALERENELLREQRREQGLLLAETQMRLAAYMKDLEELRSGGRQPVSDNQFTAYLGDTSTDAAIERMALAAAKDSLPRDGMFNSEQLDKMLSDRFVATYRRIARVMLRQLLNGGTP